MYKAFLEFMFSYFFQFHGTYLLPFILWKTSTIHYTLNNEFHIKYVYKI